MPGVRAKDAVLALPSGWGTVRYRPGVEPPLRLTCLGGELHMGHVTLNGAECSFELTV